MALESEIASAARAGQRPSMLGKERFTGAEILTHVSRSTPDVEAAELARATRYLARVAPDLAEAIGLEPPAREGSVIELLGRDVLEDLYRSLKGGDDAARAHVKALAPIEAQAAREVLRVRGEGR